MFILKIKKYRKLKRLTQKELSEISGVDQSYISRLEEIPRHRSPTLHVLEQIADALEVCPRKLVQCNCQYCRKKRRKRLFI